MEIWSSFNMEIAISLCLHNIFNISLTSGVKFHIHLWNVVVSFIFPQFCKSDMSRYGYTKYFRQSLGRRDKESRLYVFSPLHYQVYGYMKLARIGHNHKDSLPEAWCNYWLKNKYKGLQQRNHLGLVRLAIYRVLGLGWHGMRVGWGWDEGADGSVSPRSKTYP